MTDKSGLINELKVNNICKVMQQLLAEGEQTKLDLVVSTGLSNTTISDSINRLVSLGIVDICGTEKSMGGRRPVIYRIIPEYGIFLGIVLGKDALRLTVVDMKGDPIRHYPWLTYDGKPVIYKVREALELAIADFSGCSVLAAGFGVEGKIDHKEGIIIESIDLGWKNVPLKENIERQYGFFVYVDHEVNNVAVWQNALGAAKHMSSFLCRVEKCPAKTALYLDGHLCMGRENICGAWKNIEQHERFLRDAVEFLGLEAVVLGQDAGVPPSNTEGVVVFNTDETTLSYASGVMAELRWFRHIYELM